MSRLVFAVIIGSLLASPVLAATYSGGSGAEADPYKISTPNDWQQLIATSSDWDKHFILLNDIDFKGMSITPVGSSATCFSGVFDGKGFRIRNAIINIPADDVGLFGWVDSGGLIQNVGIDNAVVTGKWSVGALVGNNHYQGTIRHCYASSVVQGDYYVGGLAGGNEGVIEFSYSTSTVSGKNWVGGLVGSSGYSVRSCYATGSVNGVHDIGGLVGQNHGTVGSCYATSPVNGTSSVGGLVGENMNYFGGFIMYSYSSGAVSGSSDVGGLIGLKDQDYYGWSVMSCFWDFQTSGKWTSAAGTGKMTAEMRTRSTYSSAGWMFSGVSGSYDYWYMPNNGYPLLPWQFMATVPDVVGLNYILAVTALEDALLSVEVKHVVNETVPAGQVISQSIAPGTETWAASSVQIIVSDGVELFIRNPSMERAFVDSIAEEWSAWSTSSSGYPSYFFEGTMAHHGSKSQAITFQGYGQESFGSDGIFQVLSGLEPGKRYQVSVWFYPQSNAGWGEATCRVGIHTQASTDPSDSGTDWTSQSTSYEWKQVKTYFIAQQSTATLFIGISGSWNNEHQECWPDPEMGEFCMQMPDSWSLECYIDDIGVSELIVGANGDIQAASPVWADGIHTSEVTIQAEDSIGNPIPALPANKIIVVCSGSENEIIGPFSPTDSTGRTRAWIASTTPEIKTVRVTIMGTEQTSAPVIEFTPGAKWIKTGKRTASDGSADDYFGYSVAIDGNTAIVGAYGDDERKGSAYIFSFDGSQWIEQAKLTASDGATYDYFGYSVAIDGTTAIVGAYYDDDKGSSSGSAYIFSFDGSQWIERAKLTASDGAAWDYFGYSVAIDGNTAIVGAYGDDDKGYYSGSAYIFSFDGIQWVEQAKLTAADGVESDYFGESVAIEGNTAIVGAYGDGDKGNSSGSVYIFTLDGSQWMEQAKLTASDGAAYDNFGYSVAIDGNTAIVGAYYGNTRKGSAYIFSFDGSQWIEQAKLTASDGTGYDYFGYSVAIEGNTAVVGAYGEGDKGYYSGSAYIFSFDGSQWMEQAKLTASDGAAYNYFGRSVALDGHRAIVGNSGSVYFFQEKYLPGDFTQDAQVDLEDFSYLTARWLLTDCQSTSWCQGADLNQDGSVNISDLLLFAKEWLTNEL
jgi:hypothetical protein